MINRLNTDQFLGTPQNKKITVKKINEIIDLVNGASGTSFSLNPFYMNVIPTANNYTIFNNGTSALFLNAPTSTSVLALTKGNGSYFALYTGDTNSGGTSSAIYRTADRTNITAGGNLGSFMYIYHGIQQWATGAVPIVTEFVIGAPTLTAVAASTFTDVYNLYVNSPIAGTNATITNNWALGINGNLKIEGTRLNVKNLPTSSSGLASGDVYLNSNVLTIVP